MDNGADAVYTGLKGATNARHFAGLNFNDRTIRSGVEYVRRHRRKIFLAINTYPQPEGWPRWQQAVDRAAELGVDALIVADIGVMDYAAERWPGLAAKGLESRLNNVLIDRYGSEEKSAYPALCKGRFRVGGEPYYAIEEPTSLNTLEILPELLSSGVAAIKMEGRQRSPAYVAQVTRVMRAALDACHDDPEHFKPREEWMNGLEKVSEGSQTTLGAYHRPWQ